MFHVPIALYTESASAVEAMRYVNEIGLFRRMDDIELSLCLALNRFCARRYVERVFSLISRLGNGVFWYTLIALLPAIYGTRAFKASIHLAAVGAVGVIVYKLVKSTMVRQRPYVTHGAIRRGTAPLDLYSFPSGHTLHAVSFSLVAVTYYPQLAWLVAPFAALVALSRVVLGLHYPSDVVVGAAMGLGIAQLSLVVSG